MFNVFFLVYEFVEGCWIIMLLEPFSWSIMRAWLLIEIFIQSGDAYTLAMAWVGYICMWLKTLSRLLYITLSTFSQELYSLLLYQQQAINIINNLLGLCESRP